MMALGKGSTANGNTTVIVLYYGATKVYHSMYYQYSVTVADAVSVSVVGTVTATGTVRVTAIQ